MGAARIFAMRHGKSLRSAETSAIPWVAGPAAKFLNGVSPDLGEKSKERRSKSKHVIKMSASLIGHSGSSAFRLSTNSSVDVAHGLALLFGIGTRGPSIMGFEDEVAQSIGRPCRQTNGRSKRTCELTSSIVPRGTSFHRSVELECPSYRIWRFCAPSSAGCRATIKVRGERQSG